MDIIDEFPGMFFKASELAGKRTPLTITTCRKTEMNDGKAKPVLYFKEDTRGLVLNVENRTELAARFGRDTQAWAGKKITLITRRVNGPKGPCDGIRLADPPTGEMIGDDIPFGDDDVTREPPLPRRRPTKAA